MTEVELLRHVADNLENKQAAGYGLLCHGARSIATGTGEMHFGISDSYTLAPRTHIANGFEVPAPLSVAPERGQKYATVALSSPSLRVSFSWDDDETENRLLSRKLCFSTEEDAQQNGLAMLGHDPKTTKVGDV